MKRMPGNGSPSQLDRLSVKHLSQHDFECDGSPEHQDYLIRLENSQRTNSHRFVVHFAVLRAHHLFLFDHDSSLACSELIDLKSFAASAYKPVERWPANCSEGCKLAPIVSEVTTELGGKHEAGQQLFGFFSGSEWPQQLEASGKLARQLASAENGSMATKDGGSNALSSLWASLGSCSSSHPSRSSVALSAAAAAAQLKPPKPPKPSSAPGKPGKPPQLVSVPPRRPQPQSHRIPESQKQPLPEAPNQPLPEPQSQPVSQPPKQPLPQPQSQPLPEPQSQPLPEPQRQPLPEPQSQPLTEPQTRQPLPELQSQPVSQPPKQLLLEPQGQPLPEPQTHQPLPEPLSQLVLQSPNQSLQEPPNQPLPEPQGQPLPEPKSQLIPEPQSEPLPKPQNQSLSQPQTQPLPEPQSQPLQQPQSQSLPKPTNQPVSDPPIQKRLTVPTRRNSRAAREQLIEQQQHMIRQEENKDAGADDVFNLTPTLTMPRTAPLPVRPFRPRTNGSPTMSLSTSLTSQSSSVDSEAPPALPPKPPSLSAMSLRWQSSTEDWDLYKLLTAGRPDDPVSGYLTRGYYSQVDLKQARFLMKQADLNGTYMLRGFCSRQSGMERELCVKYDSCVYKLRIRQHPKGYQVCNDCNHKHHFSMEALLFYHHIHPILGEAPVQHEFLLHRPFDAETKADSRASMTTLLSTSLWHHGSKEFCTEVLKASPVEGTYALRTAFEGDTAAVLCVTHRCQILKLRIGQRCSDIDPQRKEFGFQSDSGGQTFASLEELILYHHKNPICRSPSDHLGDVILQMPFQLVPRCQQVLAVRYRPLDSVCIAAPTAAAVDWMYAVSDAEYGVCRMRNGNFQLLLRPRECQKQHQAATIADSPDDSQAVVEYALLLIRDDNGRVQKFRITERTTDLSFGPPKLYAVFGQQEKPELVTEKLEKMIFLLCNSARLLSPDIMSLVMSSK